MRKYKLSALTPIQIANMDKIEIAKQNEIKGSFGEPLVLSQAYYFLRDASSNFTNVYDLALDLDNTLFDLLKQKGFFGDKEAATDTITNTAALLQEAIESLQIALEFSDNKQQLQEAIEALEVAKEFL